MTRSSNWTIVQVRSENFEQFYTSLNCLTLKPNYIGNIIHGLQGTNFPTEAAAINPTSQQTTNKWQPEMACTMTQL
jgi:hypothetical protein